MLEILIIITRNTEEEMENKNISNLSTKIINNKTNCSTYAETCAQSPSQEGLCASTLTSNINNW